MEITTRLAARPGPAVGDSALDLVATAIARWFAAVDTSSDLRVYADVHATKGKTR